MKVLVVAVIAAVSAAGLPGCGAEDETKRRSHPAAADATTTTPAPATPQTPVAADGEGDLQADDGGTDPCIATPVPAPAPAPAPGGTKPPFALQDPCAPAGDDGGGDADTGITGNEDPRRGAVEQVTSGGRVYGWAVDKTDLKRILEVEIVLGGLKSAGGIVAARTTANKATTDGNHAGYHGFFIDIPASYRTGAEFPLFVYADGNPVNDEPATFRAFKGSTEGKAFFDAEVAPKMTVCTECHTVSYDQFFPSFLGTGPNEGGTATNNSLINKPANQNGASHAGGNRCGSLAGSPCKEMQAWWQAEFE